MQRWFAIGVDAYHVLQALSRQPLTPMDIHGLSGKIMVNGKDGISRQLALGRFGPDGVVLEKTR
jgi:outer membrane PBP1 activator LpoA protein